MASDMKADQRTAAVILAPLVVALVAPLLVAIGQGLTRNTDITSNASIETPHSTQDLSAR